MLLVSLAGVVAGPVTVAVSMRKGWAAVATTTFVVGGLAVSEKIRDWVQRMA